MFGGPSGPLRDLLATTEQADSLAVAALASARAARKPVHKDAPQAHHLDVAIRHLEAASQRLRHVTIVHTLDDVDQDLLVA